MRYQAYKQIFRIATLSMILGLIWAIGLHAALAQSENQTAETSLRWDSPELRFITQGDYPPFNYYDEDGALTGFNIDLARIICLEMEVRCDFKVVPWNDQIKTLNSNGADAIISSLAITEKSIQKLSFTDRYFNMHARFAMRANDKLDEATPEDLSRYTIGVIANTAHEAYLKDFFIYSSIKPFKSHEEMHQALKTEKVDVVFGDGISLMFWLNGTNSEGCCKFFGKSFTESRYFGEGIAIALAKDNKKLRDMLNKVLKKLKETGRYEELILRYFPLGL